VQDCRVLIRAILECVGLNDAAHLLVANEETERFGLPIDGIVAVVCVCTSQAGMSLAASSSI